MKILRFLFTTFLLFQILSVTFALRNVCKYRGRQMTPGQTVTDCYATATCKTGGVLVRKESCPRYVCEHKLRGYKQFNHRKPFPECCGGPTCDEQYKLYFTIPWDVEN